MFKSKSFVLEKRKRKMAKIRGSSPGRYLFKFSILLGMAGFIAWFIIANIPPDDESLYNPYSRTSDKYRCVSYNIDGIGVCIFTCTNTDIAEVSDFLQNQTSCITRNTVYLNNIQFPETINKDWLNTDFRIDELIINQANLKTIDADAFHNDENFQTLQILRITSAETNIPHITKSFLGHLKSLRQLKLATKIGSLSPDYLAELVNLQVLQVNGIAERKSPTDLIGNVTLPKVFSVHLSNNNFGDTIDEFTFQNVAFTNSLYLMGCQINFLPAHSFDLISPNSKFLDLDLRNNNLKVISAILFEHLLEIANLGSARFELSGNPLDCTSELLPLAQMIVSTKIFEDRANVKCASPPELENKTLVPNILPPPPPPTSSELPTTTTTKPPCPEEDSSLTRITCKWDDNHKSDQCSSSSDIDTLLVQKKLANFSITKLSSRTVKISLESEQIDENLAIVWFSNSSADIGKIKVNEKKECLGWTPLYTQNYSVRRLTPNKVYTFCLIQTNAMDISPLNCRSYFLKADCSEEDADDFQTTVIVVSIMSILVAGLLGALTMFFVAKYNPDIVNGLGKKKSSKRVNVNQFLRETSFRRSSRKIDLSKKKRNTYMESTIPDYEVIPSHKTVTYFERLPNDSPPPLPKRRPSSVTSESDKGSRKLELIDVTEDDGYFTLYSGV